MWVVMSVIQLPSTFVEVTTTYYSYDSVRIEKENISPPSVTVPFYNCCLLSICARVSCTMIDGLFVAHELSS